MTRLQSALYVGKVTHARFRPVRHSFTYRVFYMLIDIDELDDLDDSLRWFSVGRFNLFGFEPGLHGAGDETPLRAWVDGLLREAGVDLQGGRIQLLTFPRVLGYVFNPISIWYCHRPDGELAAVIHEVRNTFGDRHTYVVPLASDDRSHRFAKKLHVSPFNGMDQEYRFELTPPGERVSVAIDQTERDGQLMRAGLALSRRRLSDANLLEVFASHPLLTAKVIAAIHWQALKLWLRGARFHSRPEPGSHDVTIVRADRVAA